MKPISRNLTRSRAATAMLLFFVVGCQSAVLRAEPREAKPQLMGLLPRDGETLHMPNPHFRWDRQKDANVEDRCLIQIARDPDFKNLVRDDAIEVVSRYVCAEPLTAGTYYWRVRLDGGAWPAQACRFVIAESQVFEIPAGASQTEIEQVFKKASSSTPAKVLFPPGKTLISKTINVARTSDLIIDGRGSTLVIAAKPFHFTFSKNITLQNMTVEPEIDPSTHVEIVGVDPSQKTVTVKPKPGFPQDVGRYFTPGSGASILRCIDLKAPGKAIRQAGLSAQDAGAAITGPDAAGHFTFHNVKDAGLKAIKPGMEAYVIKYAYGLVTTSFTDNLTLCRVALLGTGGGFGGLDSSAQSYLGCTFLPLTPDHRTGAQGIIGSGRIGMWFENCQFEYAVDDNMAVAAFKMSLEAIADGNLAVLKPHPWNQEIGPGDEVLLWDVKANRTARATVLEALDQDNAPVATGALKDPRPKKLRLAKNATLLNEELGRRGDASFMGVLVFRYSPSNEDFVFRKNTVFGGSAGSMFNGMRGLLADNTFTNCRGTGVASGYHSPQENCGYGARDVLVRGNTMTNCGGSGVEVRSTANVGGNIIIKENRITYRDSSNGFLHAAVFIKNNCDHVVVKNNVFDSDVAPERGGWIVTKDNQHPVEHHGNEVICPVAVPMLRESNSSGE